MKSNRDEGKVVCKIEQRIMREYFQMGESKPELARELKMITSWISIENMEIAYRYVTEIMNK